MSSKVRLWLNLFAIFVAFALIVIAIGAMIAPSSRFLSMPGIDNKVKDLNMEIEATINGNQFFKVSFLNGHKEQDIDEIDKELTTFTMDNRVLTLSFVFDNKSTGMLYVKIEGIYIDKADRFRAQANLSNNPSPTSLLRQEGDTYSIYFSIKPPEENTQPNLNDGSSVQLDLIYTLNTYDKSIRNAEQNLEIIISNTNLDA